MQKIPSHVDSVTSFSIGYCSIYDPKTLQIAINKKWNELWTSFWSHFVTFSMPIPTMGHLYMFKKDNFFQNSGHVIDDVTTCHMTDPQKFSKKFQKFLNNYLHHLT